MIEVPSGGQTLLEVWVVNTIVTFDGDNLAFGKWGLYCGNTEISIPSSGLVPIAYNNSIDPYHELKNSGVIVGGCQPPYTMIINVSH